MKTPLATLLLIGGSALAQAPATSAPSTTQQQPAAILYGQAKPLDKEDIEKIRAEIRASKSDLVAKNMTLTSDEAAAFWPLYKQYEAATKALNDERFELLRKFMDAGEKTDPAVGANWLKASLKRDLDMAKLR